MTNQPGGLDLLLIGDWAASYEHHFTVTQSLASGQPYTYQGSATFVKTRLVPESIAAQVPNGAWLDVRPGRGITLSTPGDDQRAVVHQTSWTTVANWLRDWTATDRMRALGLAALIRETEYHDDEQYDPRDLSEIRAQKESRRLQRLATAGSIERLRTLDNELATLIGRNLAPANPTLFYPAGRAAAFGRCPTAALPRYP